jgi:hypothetical protein
MKDESDRKRWSFSVFFILHPSSFILAFSLVVARNRLDGVDDFVVGDFVCSAEETGVAAVHEDRAIALGIAPQGTDQLPAFDVIQGTEVHGTFSFRE